MAASRFDPIQRAYSRQADPAHYHWQTRASYFAETEADLVADLHLGPDEALLEIGCGEGGNLHHLRGRGRLRVGIDFSPEKAAFAARYADAHSLVADAAQLPFPTASFDAVLIRDLLHHVNDRVRVLSEARRVLRTGGRLTLIEPNALSPLILLQAAVQRAERGVLASTGERLRREIEEAGLRIESHRARQPLPLARVLLHPKLPIGGDRALLQRVLQRFDSVAARMIPRRAWMYLVYQAVKP